MLIRGVALGLFLLLLFNLPKLAKREEKKEGKREVGMRRKR